MMGYVETGIKKATYSIGKRLFNDCNLARTILGYAPTFAHVSRRPTVRLNTKWSGAE